MKGDLIWVWLFLAIYTFLVLNSSITHCCVASFCFILFFFQNIYVAQKRREQKREKKLFLKENKTQRLRDGWRRIYRCWWLEESSSLWVQDYKLFFNSLYGCCHGRISFRLWSWCFWSVFSIIVYSFSLISNYSLTFSLPFWVYSVSSCCFFAKCC